MTSHEDPAGVAKARYWRAVLVVLLLHCSLSGAASSDARHVLVLSSSERPFAPQSEFVDAFVPELIRGSREPINVVEMSVQNARSSGVPPDVSVAERLRSTFGTHKLDLVITIGGPAATFAQEFGQELFPATPILIAGVDRRFVENARFTDRETTVATEHEPSEMIDEILRLLPDTRTVMVVVGASHLEQFWLREMKREFGRFGDRLQFVWTNDLKFSEILERSRSMPVNSAVFFAILATDASGEPHIGREALTTLHAAANAPLFALHGLGQGIVGGPLLDTGELSRTTAAVALRILAGESPHAIKTPIQHAGPPTFDWRELRRWNVAESRLSPGSVVMFREPRLWGRPVVLGALIIAPLVGIVLLVGLVKRRRARGRRPVDSAERWILDTGLPLADITSLGRARVELSHLSQHLLQAHERERATVAKKLHEDICQRITALTIQLRSLKATSHEPETQTAIAEISEQLAGLVGEIVALPDPVYQKLELLGLTAACRRLCEELSAQYQVAVHFQHEYVPSTLPPDVALVLFRVLQEAALNAVIHSGTDDVWVWLRGSATEVRLQVVDWGAGFDTESEVPTGGVGLVKIRERLKLVNGGSSIVSRPGEGTRVDAWVPLS